MPKLVQLDKPSSHKRKRSTQKQRAVKVREASLLLAKGFVRADIVPLLMRKYECSRATANRLVDTADIERTKESQLHWIEDDQPLSVNDSQALMVEARQMIVEASTAYCETGDTTQAHTFCRLVNAYEKLARMGGKFHETTVS